tara:strand:- start:498 stop:653 length:156 start_codon:yes stop_codon:yes gene_type:complete
MLAPLKKSTDPVYIPKGTAAATELALPVFGRIMALVWDLGLRLVGTHNSSY